MTNIVQVKIGGDLVISVDKDRLPANVMEHVEYIGLRNILMDAHASITAEEYGDETDSASMAVAQKKLDAMYAGEVRQIAERTTDPVRQLMLDAAEKAARALWKKTAAKGDKFDNPRKRAAEHLEQNPEFAAKVQALAQATFGE